jgi:general secretion pathway protein B
MSFILDALKKSESERHRQTGPVLMDVRIAPPRRRIPPWAWVIAGVLVVNLGVLAWILWLSPARQSAPATPVVAAAPTASAPPAASAPAGAPTAPAAAPTAVPAPPASALPPPTLPVATPESAALPPPPVPMPQVQPAAPGSQNIDVATLPKVADMLAAGVSLPELQLNWHVYDAAPQSRYVLLNGVRMREGDSTQAGVRVVAIVPTGVVVEWRGRRMILNAGH